MTVEQAIANGRRDRMLGPDGTRVLIEEVERLRRLEAERTAPKPMPVPEAS